MRVFSIQKQKPLHSPASHKLPECLECREPVRGRSDKKFCCSQCRTTFYNRQNSDTNNFVRKINRILRRNRKILSGFNPDGKATVAKSALRDKGFNFNYFTNIYETRKGNRYYFCYDQGYLEIDNSELLALVRRQEYVR